MDPFRLTKSYRVTSLYSHFVSESTSAAMDPFRLTKSYRVTSLYSHFVLESTPVVTVPFRPIKTLSDDQSLHF